MNHPDIGQNPDYGIVITQLHVALKSTLAVLSKHIEAHGMISGREDETLALGALATQAALDVGLIDAATGRMPTSLAVLPVDDDTRPFSDSLLPEAMIEAGMAALDRVDEDLGNYVSGKTIDWDNGMAAGAVYRAMTRAMLERLYRCRLDIESRMTSTLVRAVSPEAAARAHAMATFHDSKGEWMGGGITVVNAEGETAGEEPEMIAARVLLFGTRYDTSIEFDATRDGEPNAVAVEVPRSKP